MDKEKLTENFRQVLDGLPDDADITKFLFCVAEGGRGFYAVLAGEKAYSGNKGHKIEVLVDSLSITIGLITAQLMSSNCGDLRIALDKMFSVLKQESDERLSIIEQSVQKKH